MIKFIRLHAMIIAFLSGFCVMTGCASDDEPIGVVDLFGDMTEAESDKYPIVGIKEIAGFGSYPNDIAVYNNYAYIVDYSNNSIHRLNLKTYERETPFIDLGQNAGPYSVYVDSKNIYVTVQGVAEVWKYDHDGNNKIVINEEVAGTKFIAPTDVATYSGHLYIADSGYDYANPAKTQGFMISMLSGSDGEADEISINYYLTNPVYLRIFERNREAYIFLVDAGIILYNEDYTIQSLPDRTCVWGKKIGRGGFASDNEYRGYACAQNASIGSISWSKDRLYVGDATQPQYYSVSIDDMMKTDVTEAFTLKVHRLSDEDYTTTTKPLVVGNALAVFDSAKDTLHWIEDGKETVFALSRGDVRKMPIDAEYDAINNQIVVLNSASGTVDVIKVR